MPTKTVTNCSAQGCSPDAAMSRAGRAAAGFPCPRHPAGGLARRWEPRRAELRKDQTVVADECMLRGPNGRCRYCHIGERHRTAMPHAAEGALDGLVGAVRYDSLSILVSQLSPANRGTAHRQCGVAMITSRPPPAGPVSGCSEASGAGPRRSDRCLSSPHGKERSWLTLFP